MLDIGPMKPPLYIFPFTSADGPVNMATDELLLAKAIQGQACFRWYAWEPHTLSLGYFQQHEERNRLPQWRNSPWVRRATGGGAIWHAEEKTYAFALPANIAEQKSPSAWHESLHETMAIVLRQNGIDATVLQGQRRKPSELEYLCFTVPQPGDVLLAGRKIIGGAQRLKHGALVQHGSVLQPAGDVLQERWLPYMAQTYGWETIPAMWTETDEQEIAKLAVEKYRSDTWNAKR
jgi:lipoyl(octanoyl) transferase